MRKVSLLPRPNKIVLAIPLKNDRVARVECAYALLFDIRGGKRETGRVASGEIRPGHTCDGRRGRVAWVYGARLRPLAPKKFGYSRFFVANTDEKRVGI